MVKKKKKINKINVEIVPKYIFLLKNFENTTVNMQFYSIKWITIVFIFCIQKVYINSISYYNAIYYQKPTIIILKMYSILIYMYSKLKILKICLPEYRANMREWGSMSRDFFSGWIFSMRNSRQVSRGSPHNSWSFCWLFREFHSYLGSPLDQHYQRKSHFLGKMMEFIWYQSWNSHSSCTVLTEPLHSSSVFIVFI